MTREIEEISELFFLHCVSITLSKDGYALLHVCTCTAFASLELRSYVERGASAILLAPVGPRYMECRSVTDNERQCSIEEKSNH